MSAPAAGAKPAAGPERGPKGARGRGIQANLDADIPHYETEVHVSC